MKDLREKVQDALGDDPRTREASIEILNKNGVVTLGGSVPEAEISTAAESITRDVNGVVSVINEIQVREDQDNDNPYDVSGTLDEDVIVK